MVPTARYEFTMCIPGMVVFVMDRRNVEKLSYTTSVGAGFTVISYKPWIGKAMVNLDSMHWFAIFSAVAI